MRPRSRLSRLSALNYLWVCPLLWQATVPLQQATAQTDLPSPPGRPDLEASSVVERAQRFIESGDLAAAEKLLLEATLSAPRDPAVFMALGTLLEGQGRRDEALAVYGTLLAEVDPNHAEARRRFRRMFFEGNFPRRIPVAHLPLSPVSFSIVRCLLHDEGTQSNRPGPELAHTTSLLFPPELARGGQAPWVRLPPLGGVPGNVRYNRVLYGLVGDGSGEVLVTRWVVGYPSPTILASARDYAGLAGFLTSVLLRGQVYLEAYLGLGGERADGELYSAFLTEEGPTGAEQFGGRIFFMDVGRDRTPLEWVREAFHELGHLFLPRIGPFPGEERWASGELGERLLLQWLAEEAEGIAGAEWPSPEAQASLDGVWNVGHLDAHRYLTTECRVPMAAWLATPPEDFEGNDGIARLVGFALWIQAAHGRRALSQVLSNLSDTTPSAFAAAYRAVVIQRLSEGSLSLNAGGIHLTASQLAAAPTEGALRRKQIFLAPGGSAVFRAWLPAGRWRVQVETTPDGQDGLTLSLDEGTPALSGAEGWELGDVPEGWHKLVIRSGRTDTVKLEAVRISP